MAISKDKKRELLAKITAALKEASSVVFVGFDKFKVTDASRMRRELSKADVHYFVAKKTLLHRALAERAYEGNIPDLPGEVAIAWTTSENVTAPARGIYDYGKKLKGVLKLLGGVFEGSFTDAQKITAIATIPPLPVLRGMFVNVLNSSIQGFVTALDKVREQKANVR